MPTIPAPVLNEGLPSRSGMRGGVQQVPDVPHAPGSLAASQILGTAAAGLGTAVLTANELAMQRAAIEERKAKANAVIAGNLTGLEALPALQTLYEQESQDPDYSTFAARVLTKGQALINEQGQGLTPDAIQAYRTRIQDNLNVLHQRALGDANKRMDEAGTYVASTTVAQSQQAMIEAKTSLEFDVARGTMVKTLTDMVNTGLARGAPAAELIRKTDEEVATQRTQRANRVTPAAMITHLKALADGKDGTPGLPVPPGHTLAAMLDDARQQRIHAQAETHRGDLQADKDVAKTQEQAEMKFSNELSAIMQTERPDPVALQTIQRQIMAAGVAPTPNSEGMISQAGHTRLMALSTSFLNAATRPREAKEDQRVVFMLESGWPRDEEIKLAVDKELIHGATGARIMADREKKLDAAHPSKIPEVTQGKEFIRLGVMAAIGEADLPIEMMGAGGGLSGGPQRQRYQEAVRLYDDGIKFAQAKMTTPKDKIAIARDLAPRLSEEITRNYALYFREYDKENLPVLSHGIESVFVKDGLTAAVQHLHTLKGSMSQQVYDDLQKNLNRREALDWTTGERRPSTLPAAKAPEQSTADWLKGWAQWFLEMQMGATAPKPQ